jgi:hypothetical protein
MPILIILKSTTYAVETVEPMAENHRLGWTSAMPAKGEADLGWPVAPVARVEFATCTGVC